MPRAVLALAVLIAAAAVSGCESPEGRSRIVVRAYFDDLAKRDGGDACELLTIEARRMVERSFHGGCATAILRARPGAEDLAKAKVDLATVSGSIGVVSVVPFKADPTAGALVGVRLQRGRWRVADPYAPRTSSIGSG